MEGGRGGERTHQHLHTETLVRGDGLSNSISHRLGVVSAMARRNSVWVEREVRTQSRTCILALKSPRALLVMLEQRYSS